MLRHLRNKRPRACVLWAELAAVGGGPAPLLRIVDSASQTQRSPYQPLEAQALHGCPLLPFGARGYAKGGKKDKSARREAKGRKGDEPNALEEHETHASGDASWDELDLSDVKGRMRAASEHLVKELSKLRSGRAAPGLIENIPVKVYGEVMPLKDVALISPRDAQTLVVSLYDASTSQEVEKAILESPLGLNPRGGSDTIIVPVPPMSAEARSEVAKMVSSSAEHAKVAVRARRKEALDVLKQAKKKGRSEDECARDEKAVQKLHDEFMAEIEGCSEAKRKELMSLV